MPRSDYILVGDSVSPRGVVVVVNGETIIMGTRAARQTAQAMLNAVALVEATGGTEPEIEARDRPVHEDFIRAQGFSVRVRS